MNSLSDEQIARSVQEGDSELFGELIDRYEAKLKRYGRKFLSYQDEIEDLVQDVFIKSYTNIQSFDPKMRFSPWIYRIAHNTFVNELRLKQRQGPKVFDFDTILPILSAKETADAEVLSAELRSELDELLVDLPVKYREVMVLYYLEELSYKEISEILQIPVNTVGVRINRGRKKMKESYDKKMLKQNTI